MYICTLKPLLRGPLDKRLTQVGRSVVNVNVNMKVYIPIPDKRPLLLKKSAKWHCGHHTNLQEFI